MSRIQMQLFKAVCKAAGSFIMVILFVRNLWTAGSALYTGQT